MTEVVATREKYRKIIALGDVILPAFKRQEIN